MFIDIHHHIVYGVDDGSGTLEESQQMILKAVGERVDTIVATSHVQPGIEPFPIRRYTQHLIELQKWCRNCNIPMALYPGSEIMYTDMAVRLLREGKVPTLANTRYVLVEFSVDESYEYIKAAARSLGSMGYWPVLAHAERYKCLRKYDRINELRDGYNVLIQMNAGTILDKKGFIIDRWKDKMLGAGLIDIVASDAHNTRSRKCRMWQCYKHCAERYGQDMARKLFIDIPSGIINRT